MSVPTRRVVTRVDPQRAARVRRLHCKTVACFRIAMAAYSLKGKFANQQDLLSAAERAFEVLCPTFLRMLDGYIERSGERLGNAARQYRQRMATLQSLKIKRDAATIAIVLGDYFRIVVPGANLRSAALRSANAARALIQFGIKLEHGRARRTHPPDPDSHHIVRGLAAALSIVMRRPGTKVPEIDDQLALAIAPAAGALGVKSGNRIIQNWRARYIDKTRRSVRSDGLLFLEAGELAQLDFTVFKYVTAELQGAAGSFDGDIEALFQHLRKYVHELGVDRDY